VIVEFVLGVFVEGVLAEVEGVDVDAVVVVVVVVPGEGAASALPCPFVGGRPVSAVLRALPVELPGGTIVIETPLIEVVVV
jgi:hypothetical protein